MQICFIKRRLLVLSFCLLHFTRSIVSKRTCSCHSKERWTTEQEARGQGSRFWQRETLRSVKSKGGPGSRGSRVVNSSACEKLRGRQPANYHTGWPSEPLGLNNQLTQLTFQTREWTGPRSPLSFVLLLCLSILFTAVNSASASKIFTLAPTQWAFVLSLSLSLSLSSALCPLSIEWLDTVAFAWREVNDRMNLRFI